jgi:hypothetical protein
MSAQEKFVWNMVWAALVVACAAYVWVVSPLWS